MIQAYQRAEFGGGDKGTLRYVSNLQYYPEVPRDFLKRKRRLLLTVDEQDKLEKLSLAETVERTETDKEFDEGVDIQSYSGDRLDPFLFPSSHCISIL
jgi:hypothetical protein